MDSLIDSHQISRLEIVDTGHWRRWPDEAKLRIVKESFSGPRLSSATARRHEISRQQIFAWRKAYREGDLGATTGLVSAGIAPEQPDGGAGANHSRMQVVNSNGRRVIVDGEVDVSKLVEIVRGCQFALNRDPHFASNNAPLQMV